MILIGRKYNDKQTEGAGVYLNEHFDVEFSFRTVELPWKENKRSISCIPEGVYTAVKHNSPKFGLSLWIKDVPDRSEILIHPANFVRQLRGCIAPGLEHKDIDNDGLIDVTNSRKAMDSLLEVCPDEVKVKIFEL